MFVIDILTLFMRNVHGAYLHQMPAYSGSIFIAVEMKMKQKKIFAQPNYTKVLT